MKQDIAYPISPEGEVKELKFTCPECGSNRITVVDTGITVYSTILSITADGCVTYDGGPDIDYDDVENSSYQCAQCDYELDDVHDEEELVEWLRENNGCRKEAECT